MKQQIKRKNFSRFKIDEAFKQLEINELIRWNIDFQTLEASAFFQTRLQRLECFDLTISEKAKELLIDAICEEAIQQHSQLKIWKEAPLKTDNINSVAIYQGCTVVDAK